MINHNKVCPFAYANLFDYELNLPNKHYLPIENKIHSKGLEKKRKKLKKRPQNIYLVLNIIYFFYFNNIF